MLHARGTAEAPPLIRAALFSEASNSFSESGIEVRRELIHDAGDIEVVSGEAMFSELKPRFPVCWSKASNRFRLAAITLSLIRFFELSPNDTGRMSILHFDAHPDLYDNFEGNRHSRLSVRSTMEEGLAERLVQVGIRTLNDHQRQQVERFGVEVIEMRDYRGDDWPIDFDTPVYISFDIDGLDPAFAPGVSHREPGARLTQFSI